MAETAVNLRLEAGPELDLEFGKALGFEVVTEHEDLERRQRTDHEVGTIALYGKTYYLRRKDRLGLQWTPSTSWETMGIAIEMCRERGILIDIETFPQWFLTNAGTIDGLFEDCSISRSTAPHAVTVTAILALREMEEMNRGSS